MSDLEAIKVLIVNQEGQYLTGTACEWEFTDDRTRAKVFDFRKDRVADQIEMVRRLHGKVWIAVRLDPREAYEFCDRCGSRALPVQTYFDGENFLCPDCHTRLAMASK